MMVLMPPLGEPFGKHAKTCQTGPGVSDSGRFREFPLWRCSLYQPIIVVWRAAERRELSVVRHMGGHRESAWRRFFGGQISRSSALSPNERAVTADSISSIAAALEPSPDAKLGTGREARGQDARADSTGCPQFGLRTGLHGPRALRLLQNPASLPILPCAAH